MSFWRNVNPGGAIADFIAVFRSAGSMRWRFALLAVVATGSVFSLVTREEQRIPPRAPHIIYITSWRLDRTDAEIRASNIANQKRKDAEAAEQAKRDAMVKNIYKAIGRASGMDVDAIEAKAKADDAAQARADAARSAALYRPDSAAQ